MSEWDQSVDLLVMGSGAAGLATAIRAHDLGAKVLLVEKSDLFGGNTAMSGGVCWVANNPQIAKKGIPDSDEEGLAYLGQMHGAELQRSKLTRAAASFCRENDAVYRPHPSEKDKLSRLTHKVFRRAGITVDASRPLNELTGPVVSVFSTGVLEAAAQGRDAWVHFPRPPAWLEEFWERYGMHQYGDSPTPAPARPDVEPAKRIAELLTAAAR